MNPDQTASKEYRCAGILGLGSDLDEAEDRARARCLAGILATIVGSTHPVIAALRAAEHDRLAAQRAREIIDHMPALTRRRALSIFMAVTWPRRRQSRSRLPAEPVAKFSEAEIAPLRARHNRD